MELSTSFISQIQKYFLDKPVRRGYLFGSHARKTATENSDVDILVEIDDNKMVSLLDFIGWALDLEKITHKKIDLVDADGLSKYIKPSIDKEKIKIYERT